MTLYTTKYKVVTVDTMDYAKDTNEMPYEEYGNMIYSGDLIVIRVNYDEGYTIVSDAHGQMWKVTCDMTFGVTNTFAVLTKVD